MMTILLTFVPSIVLLLYFTLSDRFKEPNGTVLLIFFLGFLICLPAGILNGLSHDFFYDGSKYSENLTSSFLGPAWAEVIAKEENVDYAELSYLIALGRSYSAIPMHGLNGAVMGYYFGMYAFTGNKKFLILSLALPYLFHGFYNFLVWPNPMIIIGILVIVSFYLHSELKKRQKLKKRENESKVVK